MDPVTNTVTDPTTAKPTVPVAVPVPVPEPATPVVPAAGEAPEPTDVASLPAWAQKELADTRKEAADNRVKAKELEAKSQATLDAIAKELGFTKDDDPAAAAKTAAEERDAARLEAKAAKVENAILKAADAHEASPAALTDSRAFMKAVADLDPTADDFAAKLGEAIKAAVEANPALKVEPSGPVRSGGEVKGSAPVPGQLTREDLKGMTPAEIVTAKAAGRCNQMQGIT